MKTIVSVIATIALVACGGPRQSSQADNATAMKPVGPTFSADSAYRFCEAQCAFGPRIMNSDAHERCAQWIAAKFQMYGMHVTEQRATLTGYDGTPLLSNNIIASYRPELADRIIICAHWDSRPWADNDPDEQNWRTPVMAANDGASGVAVMLELARLISRQGADDNAPNGADTLQQTSAITEATLNPQLGIDFICFDAEDWGTPQWAESESADTWALGAQHWARHPHREGYSARYAILLDMVGGQGARFYREGYSMQYAPAIVSRVWQAAQVVGCGGYFPQSDGGYITDDHVPVNQLAGIPCIDIIPFYPDCVESSFGPTWHTVNDDMEHIDRQTLGAVGQTLVQVLFSE
ncbi:MAG: M28 family peptidase [Prevotella sp.]|nr:M28 family peptidase [Prevotella sp.]